MLVLKTSSVCCSSKLTGVSLNDRLVCRARLLYDALDEAAADIAPEGYDGAGLVQREGVLGAGDWGDSGVDERLGGLFRV